MTASETASTALSPDHLTPDDLARACADAMWAQDNASQGLGIERLHISAGCASLAMTVLPHMVNGHGLAHGGFIFTLADSTFAFACNTYNERTVAAHCSIAFLQAGKLGDRLIATAMEVSRIGRSGIYDIRVTAHDQIIAEFRGHSRTIGGAIITADTTGR